MHMIHLHFDPTRMKSTSFHLAVSFLIGMLNRKVKGYVWSKPI